MGLRRGPGGRVDPHRWNRSVVPGPWGGEGPRRGPDAVLRDPRRHNRPDHRGVARRGPHRVFSDPGLRAERVDRTRETSRLNAAGVALKPPSDFARADPRRAMQLKYIELQKEDGVAIAWLNKPKANTYDLDLMR